MATNDGDKIAAAILAVEASRQMQVLNPQLAQRAGFNVFSELLNHYRSILAQLESAARSGL